MPSQIQQPRSRGFSLFGFSRPWGFTATAWSVSGPRMASGSERACAASAALMHVTACTTAWGEERAAEAETREAPWTRL